MHLTSQVIARNESEFSKFSNLLIINPPESDDLNYLNPSCVLTLDFRVYESLASGLGEKLIYGFPDNLKERLAEFDGVLIFSPKAKGELDIVLDYLTSLIDKEIPVYMVGEKKAGIASCAKKLISLGDDGSKIDSAKHCQLWHVTNSTEKSAFSLDDWIENYEAKVNDVSLKLATIPGVFSYGHLDEGTSLLLGSLNLKLSGRVLDFGCGSGVIGIYAALNFDELAIEMVDINWLALKCAERSAELNKVNAKIYPSDGWNQVKGRVNGVLTNPPFHSGVRTEYTTTEGFISVAKDKLSKGAPLVLVANSFLKYGPVIESTFESYKTLSETNKFRVYLARR